MKKNLLILFAICIQLAVYAQITITPVPSSATANLDDPMTNPIDVAAHSTITNEAAESKTFRWTRTIVEAPDQWGIAVCDVNLCYDTETDTETFQLGGGASSLIDVHAYPSGTLQYLDGAVPGDATVMITVVEVGNESNTATGEYLINVRGEAIPSGLSEFEIAQLKLFPNPSSDYFEVQGPLGVETISIYNLLGSPVDKFDFLSGANYDISTLPKGLYLVALADEDNQLLKTVRLQKQ